ncbi:hypothetical protein COT44_00480 [Candidatus Shapirobacteria bacterium CG08_land_8_20_14_0_20_39_18]|uniref:Uncharacterized protein n=1 Tax=Candidatus Shapirobacteria bacterium CG08_land_8_20_14_0_20_39_18 TaxID=1974883 RepID=A0A2M6XE91_9BACT|nr:MAG: hypothetical protein COT44_00480 [Candidatus Shapirobacteria bacterium CG08_land_8_20_14_0_20_39_18]PIY66439.1 MAG: hypothetical protein COY91_00660 [Candidatus Shapirobacteria bacterium CG_4_10_14_0_8_um_filter_39_15]PJE68411.1 MAG: hypothetical protein COU94_02070 [Candidatus Shapirobacteria bacterium CG10_big_fil_rev_8_21_14_0_10_38_8]
MTKYKQLYFEMVQNNKDVFEEFKKIHDLYRADPDKYQEKYNEVGKPIMEIIRKWESRLCGKMEGSGRGLFSGGVSEKFMVEIRANFPKIDMVGVKRSL